VAGSPHAARNDESGLSFLGWAAPVSWPKILVSTEGPLKSRKICCGPAVGGARIDTVAWYAPVPLLTVSTWVPVTAATWSTVALPPPGSGEDCG